MPTVPSIEQTAGGAQPFSAPNTVAVRNAAPEQQEALGQAMQAAGSLALRTGQTIGDRVAEQVDDARTKQAETGFLGQAQSLLNDPQSGYLRKVGQDAVSAYDPAKQALVKAGNDALNGLDNPIQKHMFQQVMQEHLMAFGKQMADHNHSQSVAWSASESKARAESYQLLALGAADSRYQQDADGNAVGDFAKYTGQMEQEVYHAAALAGFDQNSAQAKAMLREQYTGLNTAIISNLLDNHDGAGAKQWFDEQSAKGNIDIRNLTPLGNAVKAEYSRQQTLNYVDNEVVPAVLSSGGKAPVTLAMPVAGSSIQVTAGLGEPRAGGRKHDGIDIAVPVGTSVTAPAGGKVIKVWNDEQFGGGLSVQLQLPNGYTAGFAHLSAANVREGDEVQQGTQLGLSGKSGNATGPVLHYAMKNDKGQWVDPRTVSQAQPSPTGMSDPAALSKGMQMIQSSDLAPEQKKSAMTYLESLHAHYRTAENEQEAQTFKQASDAFYSGGMNWRKIPPSLFAKLTPEQQHKFQDEQTNEVLKNYNQSQEFKRMGETDLVSYFDQNPDMLTPANVDAARPKMANSTYLTLMSRASNLQQNPKGVVEAQGVTSRINYFAGQAGVNIAPKTTADKATLNQLHYRINQGIEQVKSQNNGKATGDQVDKVIQQELIQHTISTPRSVFNPIRILGFGDSSNTQRYSFQLPPGATHVAPGSDGKQHYTDATGRDLGVAQ